MAVGGYLDFGSLLRETNANTGIGNFIQGSQDMRNYITGLRMNRERGNLASALESGDYNKASQIAMNAGDLNSALQFAELQDKKTSREAQAAYQNAMLGQQIYKTTQDAIKENKKSQQEFLKNTPSVGMVQTLDAMLNQNNQLYDTFDDDIKGREAYANMSGAERETQSLSRKNIFASKSEYPARRQFDTLKKQSVVELRQQMKGQGTITDNETALLKAMENAKDPYDFEIAGNALRDLMYQKTQSNAQLYDATNPLTARPEAQQQNEKQAQADDILNQLKARKAQ